MTPQQLQTLRTLATSKEKNAQEIFLSKLAEFYNEAELNLENFIAALTSNNISIFATWITAVGLMFSQGKKNVTKNTLIAFQFYELGATRGDLGAHYNLAYYHFDGRAPHGENLELAEQHARKSIQSNSNSTRARNYILGKILYHQNKKQEALTYFDFIKAEDGEFYSNSMLHIAYIYVEQKKYDQAIQHLEKIKKEHEQIVAEMKKLRRILFQKATQIFEDNKDTGDYKESIDILKPLNSYPAYEKLAEIAEHEKNPKEAIFWLKKIGEDYPLIGRIRKTIHRIFAKTLLDAFPPETQEMPEVEMANPTPPNEVVTSQQSTEGMSVDGQSSSEDASQKNQAHALTFKVCDPRWVPVTDEIQGFTHGSMPHEKLAAFIQEAKHVTHQISLFSKEKEMIEEQLEQKDYPEELKPHLQQRITKLDQKITEFKNRHQELLELKATWEELTEPNVRRRKRVVNVEERYFHPRHTKREFVRYTARKTLANRLTTEGDDHVEPIVATGEPARAFLTSERALLETAIALDATWTTNPTHNKTLNSSSYYGYGQTILYYSNTEKVQMGETCIAYRQRTDAKKQRPGDAYVDGIAFFSNYSTIYKILSALCENKPEREKQLALLMRRFSHDGQPIVFEDLMAILAIEPELISEDTDLDEYKKQQKSQVEKLVDPINRICFLAFVKEPSEWFASNDDFFKYGLITAQARAMRLLCEGHLTLQDVFDQDAPYGVFTGSNLIRSKSEIQEKITRINSVYEEWLKITHSTDYMKFFKQHIKGEVLATRAGYKKDLAFLYGGEGDSDGEGYDSDGEERMLTIPSCL